MLKNNLFSSSKINHTEFSNRLIVAPMTRVSANYDGTVGPLMDEYYTDFALGGFGGIITEGLYTDQNFSQGYANQPGLTNDEQAHSWEEVVKNVHSSGSKIIAQLMHAGALSQFNRYSDEVVGPSAVQPLGAKMPFYDGSGPFSIPRSMNINEIEDAITGFVESARLAKQVGFDGVEIHGANGYLLDQFLTNYTNFRSDRYGGDLDRRIQLIRDVIYEVKSALGNDYVVGIRLSQTKVNDSLYCWPGGRVDAKKIFFTVSNSGASYIHTTEPDLNRPLSPGGKPLSFLAKKYGGIPVISNGGVLESEQAIDSINMGGADFVSIGKAALANSDWPKKIKSGSHLESFDFEMLSPRASLDNADKYISGRYALK